MLVRWIYNCSSYLRKTCDGEEDLQLFELSAEDMNCVGDMDLQFFDSSVEYM
jgi:hypothetical protein